MSPSHPDEARMTPAGTSHASIERIRLKPAVRRGRSGDSRRCGLGGAVQDDVPGVDDEPQSLPDREHRIAPVQGVREECHAPEEAQVPEQLRDDHTARTLRNDPLDEEARAEDELPEKTDRVPGGG